MKIKSTLKIFSLMVILIAPNFLAAQDLSAQLAQNLDYFKINGEVVGNKYEVPTIQTKIKANFIYDKILRTGDSVEISINRNILATRFKNRDISFLTKIKADFNFKITTPDSVQEVELVGQSEYTFNSTDFEFKFINTGSYQIDLIVLSVKGGVLATESYLVNVGAAELAPDIKINNILQTQNSLNLEGNERLTFDTNYSGDGYNFIWGNDTGVLSEDKSFSLNLEESNSKPNYIVLRVQNKNSNVLSESYIYFDYSQSKTYVVEGQAPQNLQLYDVDPPEIVEENSNSVVLLSLAGLAILVTLIAFVMFRLIKSAKINS